MASFRALVLRHTLRTFLRPRLDGETEIWKTRRDTGAPKVMWAGDVEISRHDAREGGDWLTPSDGEEDSEAAILYLHGGAYMVGSPKIYRPLTTRLCRHARRQVLAPRYRLSPEHTYPAAREDALAAFDALLAAGKDPAKIAIGGDSAGGNLTMSLLLALKERGGPIPGAAFLYSPWTDLTASGESVTANDGRDDLLQAKGINTGATYYAGDAPLDAPGLSPLFGDMTGMPPMLIYASEQELLLSDATRLKARVEAAGGTARLIIQKGLPHAWPAFTPLLPEGDRTLRETADFLRTTLPR